MKILRFWGAALAIVASGLLLCLWLQLDGEIFGLATDTQRLRASLVVAGACLVLLVAKEAFAPMWRKREDQAQQALRPSSNDRARAIPDQCAKLSSLCGELRAAHGLFWRYRLRWLLVSGANERVEQVAPGLKQAGAMHFGDVILVHGAPDGIDASTWLGQVRRWRRRRPVDGVVHVTGVDDHAASDLPRTLSATSIALGWAAPVVCLHAVSARGQHRDEFGPVGAFVTTRGIAHAQSKGEILNQKLSALEYATAYEGVRLCARPEPIYWLAQVSKYIAAQREPVVKAWQAHHMSKWRHAPLIGVMFAPVFAAPDTPVPVLAEQESIARDADERPSQLAYETREQPRALQLVWHEIGKRVKSLDGRRVGFYWPNALFALVMIGTVGGCLAMTLSFTGNQMVLHDARQAVDAALTAQPATAPALRAQLALQQRIDTLEYRQQHGAPWYVRAGLNHDKALLAALWQPYGIVAMRNLRDPVARRLEASLVQLSQSRADALPSADEQKRDYDVLKTYLMLSQPLHADAAFLAQRVADQWPAIADMRTGEWLDVSRRLAAFYASHLHAHPEWRLNASNDLINAARNTIVNQIGLQNSDDTLYQSVIEQAKGKYADMSLATLVNGTDSRGLFATSQTVPGIYTRAAWDGMIAEAIDKAAKEGRVAADWVLADEGAARVPGAALEAQQDVEEVRQRLRARYFAEYTAAWQAMLNSIQWKSATNLSDAISQLTRLTDAQTSPLIALMKAVQYQAQAGRPSQALADSLVRKAQDLIGNKTGVTAPADVNPLDKPFGPLLALMGDDVVTGAMGGTDKSTGKQGKAAADFSGVSLAHFLTVATTMRLKLQQIATSADAQAMARQMAQAVFQGKLSELTQARDDAALTAASLGSQWAGFGDALFARPLDVAWQTILQPAAASLNEAWRVAVAAPFTSSFDGHYPFADTNTDASFVELGRYIKPDTGLISRFVTTQLAGILQQQGNAWAPNELAPQALQFDPGFLSALRQLSGLGAQLYAQGDASYRMQIMPHPNPDVSRSVLTIDGSTIEYFNQLETYTPITWPGNGQNGHVQLAWESLTAGTRIAFAANGDWALLRLLGTAQVKPLDSTTYALTFNQGNGFPLHYDLKVQVGAGPLDLLKLRGFKMPQRVFIVGKGGAMPALPPLPPELQ
uniref:ImcF domain protein n=1 Tax=Burkholderia sp. (strain CCGE1003) TaxID=640512 RepID=E1TAM6_BURSG